VKFLRYADDVAVGLSGPQGLAEHVKEELGAFRRDERKLELNRAKTQGIPRPTAQARVLGYEVKAATARLRKRNLRRQGSPHKVVQTVKSTVGHMPLRVPLRDLTKKLKQ
jgi:hypothetical protein